MEFFTLNHFIQLQIVGIKGISCSEMEYLENLLLDWHITSHGLDL